MDANYNTMFDDINLEEQRQRQIGFQRGYNSGLEAGWKEGFVFGLRRGAQIAAEIGFYQGFVHAWIEILEKEDEAKQRKLIALRTLLEMTRQFPKYNLEQHDTAQRLARIRSKFKQVNSLLKCEYSFNTSMEDNEDYDTNFVNYAHNQPTMSSHSYTRRSPTPNFSANKMNEMSF